MENSVQESEINENEINENETNENEVNENKKEKKTYLKRAKKFIVRITTATIPVILYHIGQTLEQIEISEVTHILNELFNQN